MSRCKGRLCGPPLYVHTYISTHIITHQTSAELHNSQTNGKEIRTQIEENLRLNIPLKTTKDIEEAIAEYTNVIQKAAWSATPDNKPQTKYPEYPLEVKDQIKEKRKLRIRWQKSRHPEHKGGYNEAARKLKDQIKRIEEEIFQTNFQSLTATAVTNYSL
jgi:CMP-N-acetylneuraminic acid synthetase